MSALFEVDRLTRTFGSVVAARDICFSVTAGSCLGIIGTNGAGKTTFVNMATGWLPPSSGSIMFRGQRVDGKPARDVTKLGLARSFQVPQLFNSATVIENLLQASTASDAKGPRLGDPWSAKRTADCRDVLNRLRIEQYADAPAARVPQGVRKLIDIAMAMMSRPALLFLDEPTSGISTDDKFAAMDTVMSALSELGVTVLFVEHDMDIVRRYASRVLAFMEGTIIADGATEAVLGHPRVLAAIVGEGRLSGGRHSNVETGRD